MDKILVFSISCLIASLYAEDCDCSKNPYDKIFQHVFYDGHYNKFALPYEEAKKITIGIGFTLVDFLGYDESNGYGLFTLWEKQTWTDSRLSWDRAEFGNIGKTIVPLDLIWSPDVVIYKSHMSHDVEAKQLAMVSANGFVTHINKAQRSVPCSLDLSMGDKMLTCIFKYGSWAHDGNMVDTQVEQGETAAYLSKDTPFYQLVTTDITREVHYYPCCAEPYVDINFNVVLKLKQ